MVSGAQVVGYVHEQVRLLAAHQIDVAHGPARTAGKRGRPDEARVPLPSKSRSWRKRRSPTGGKVDFSVRLLPTALPD